MKNKLVKMMALLTATTMVAAGVMGCGSDSSDANADANTDTTASDTTANTDTTDGADMSGTVTLAGSTSMEKLANAMNEAFMEKYPNVSATAEFTGSSAGIESLTAGSVDIGDASRALSDDEKSQGIVENIVAIDGIAVAVNKNNTVKNVTKEQLTKIYTGEITNWKELGGKDEKIVVIGREAASGTRGAFEELLEVKDKCQYAQELDNTGAVVAKCASIEGAIGYVSLDAVDKSINTLQLDGVDCTVKNIKAGKYALQRPFVMATKGKIEKQSKLVQALFDYIDSDEGQAIIKKVGLISAK